MSTSSSELPTVTPMALQVVDGGLLERADAARNRLLILAAAEQLVAERGADNVSMEAIAEAAGVGKGTIFRRFGDRVGLMHSLLDARERELQDEMIRGEPPLGPGAAPVERIVAFGRRLLEHIDRHGDLALATETGARWVRFSSPVYLFHRTHLLVLLREAVPYADTEYLADTLMAPLSAEAVMYMRRVREYTLERVQAGYEQLVRGLLG